ncbi:uncharacterized protein L201_000428 [Kwoniella dendrophila CBS 6074]|uniref:Uncharacterized protein n=1 Tax=Kwoniella dendrophila CBS 6074 TaxID=1295534 RepID=A0AAX4JL14_9TREE
MPAVSSASPSASSSRMASPIPSGSGTSSVQPIDAYRNLSTQVKKPIIPLIPSTSSGSTSNIPNLPTLLSLDPITYSARLSGKTLQTSDPTSISISAGSSNDISPLVRGKKRNRGYPSEKEKVKNEHQSKESEMKGLGLIGMRRVKRRLGGIMSKGMKISYESLIPLNHLHTQYLFQLLSLPPLPNKLPSSEEGIPITINSEVLLSKISKSDFTGVKIQVVSSRNKSLIGIGGIIIEETYSTFRLVISTKNQIKIIPKDGTLFRLFIPAYSPPRNPSTSFKSTTQKEEETEEAGNEEEFDLEKFLSKCPQYQIDLLGSNFLNRSNDRVGKKLKYHMGQGGGSGWSEEWVNQTDWSKTFNQLSDQLGENQIDEPLRMKMSKNHQKIPNKKRKRNKSRRKDPPAFGNPE